MKKTNKSPGINLLEFVTRGQLAQAMNVGPKTIKRYIDKYKDDILKIDPTFMDRVMIKPIIARFLYEKFTGEAFRDRDND